MKLLAFITLSTTASAQTAGLPPGWLASDVGIPSLRGAATHVDDSFEVHGAGEGIRLTADEFHFAYRTFTGDLDMTVRVTDLQSTTGQAALMIRESLDYRSPTAAIALRGSDDVAFQARTGVHDRMLVQPGPSARAGVWLRLARQGTTVRGYTSLDGSSWTFVGSAEISMSGTALIGLAVSSHDVTRLASARFSLSATSSTETGTVPAPWAAGDIGGPALAGKTSAADGVFTVSGAGSDIWNTDDEFRFVFQPVAGDAQIVARVDSVEGAHAWTKAGIMIRGALTGAAAHASLFASTAKGWAFQRRPYSDGSSYHTGKTGSAPGWVRLVREGQLVSASHSADGSTWALLGTETLDLPLTAYVGLAVTSHDASAVASGIFSNVRVSPLTSANTPPVVSIARPLFNATFTAPATITVTATAGDSDGVVKDVRFLADGLQIGAATGPLFTTDWANVPAGEYRLTAVATDNGGAAATSVPVLVTVKAQGSPSPSTATRLAFTASTDHATSVTSYTVELRQASDAGASTPVASRDLGKPVPVDGEILTDISTLVDDLPAGSYCAVVVAVGVGGWSSSSPSAAFTKYP